MVCIWSLEAGTQPRSLPPGCALRHEAALLTFTAHRIVMFHFLPFGVEYTAEIICEIVQGSSPPWRAAGIPKRQRFRGKVTAVSTLAAFHQPAEPLWKRWIKHNMSSGELLRLLQEIHSRLPVSSHIQQKVLSKTQGFIPTSKSKCWLWWCRSWMPLEE